MNLQYLFYIIGIIFLFATVVYFAYNYLFELSDVIKTIILILSIIVSFFLGDILWEKDI